MTSGINHCAFGPSCGYNFLISSCTSVKPIFSFKNTENPIHVINYKRTICISYIPEHIE